MRIISSQEYIEKFENLILNNNISEEEFISTIEFLTYQVPLGAKEKAIPFIVRTSLLDKDEVCQNISRCTYVPDFLKEKIPLQRCSLEGQQCFYASIPGKMINFSDGAQPSLMETTAQKIIDDPSFDGRHAVASRWQIKKQPIFWYLTHYDHSIKNNENFKLLFDETDSFLKADRSATLNYRNFTEKLNYLSKLFCRNDNREKIYRITATYCNKITESFKPFGSSYDGLIYPSANTKGEGMNIVLTKDYVEKKNIYCDLVVLYEINRNPRDIKNVWFNPIAHAKPDEFENFDFKPLNKNIL